MTSIYLAVHVSLLLVAYVGLSASQCSPKCNARQVCVPSHNPKQAPYICVRAPCPKPTGFVGICITKCKTDSECKADEICCRTACGGALCTKVHVQPKCNPPCPKNKVCEINSKTKKAECVPRKLLRCPPKLSPEHKKCKRRVKLYKIRMQRLKRALKNLKRAKRALYRRRQACGRKLWKCKRCRAKRSYRARWSCKHSRNRLFAARGQYQRNRRVARRRWRALKWVVKFCSKDSQCGVRGLCCDDGCFKKKNCQY